MVPRWCLRCLSGSAGITAEWKWQGSQGAQEVLRELYHFSRLSISLFTGTACHWRSHAASARSSAGPPGTKTRVYCVTLKWPRHILECQCGVRTELMKRRWPLASLDPRSSLVWPSSGMWRREALQTFRMNLLPQSSRSKRKPSNKQLLSNVLHSVIPEDTL
jgi:hypothetical protein